MIKTAWKKNLFSRFSRDLKVTKQQIKVLLCQLNMTRIWKIQVSQVSDFTPWSWGNHGHDVKLTNLHSTREATLAWRTGTSFLRSRKVNKQCNIQSNKIEVSQRGLEAILPYVTDVSILTVSLIISAGFVHPFRTQHAYNPRFTRGFLVFFSTHTVQCQVLQSLSL